MRLVQQLVVLYRGGTKSSAIREVFEIVLMNDDPAAEVHWEYLRLYLTAWFSLTSSSRINNGTKNKGNILLFTYLVPVSFVIGNTYPPS